MVELGTDSCVETMAKAPLPGHCLDAGEERLLVIFDI